MQKPEIVLDILSKRSQHNGIIKDVYRHLFNPEWYIFAQKLYSRNSSKTSIDTCMINDIISDANHLLVKTL